MTDQAHGRPADPSCPMRSGPRQSVRTTVLVALRTMGERSGGWWLDPPGANTGLRLARADGDEQRAVVGHQHAGRVGFFLRVDDFDAAHQRMRASAVEFVTEPREERYGRFAVFRDVAGNRLGTPRPVLLTISTSFEC